MKFGLWLLPAAAVGAVGTLLAAALPVPPSLPSMTAGPPPATRTQLAAAPGPSTPAVAAIPPAATPTQPPATPYVVPTAVPPAPATARPKRVTAAAAPAPARSSAPKHVARSPVRHLAKATPDRHRQTASHPVEPRYGALVPKPPGPYPGMPVREPTHLAMVPPPYGMPPPYWRPPYPPYPPN
jgi:hypothetical protein